MKVVNVTSQQQCACASKELKYEPSVNFEHYGDKTCISIDPNNKFVMSILEYNQEYVFTFEQWVLEHCKEKYKGNPIVKCLNRRVYVQINSDKKLEIRDNNVYVNSLCGKYTVKIFNSYNFQFATIIEKSIEQQPDLLAIAKEKYPIGTKFYDEKGNIREVSGDKHYSHNAIYVYCGATPCTEWLNNATVNSNPLLYDNGKWAEIIPSEPEQWIPKVDEWVERIEYANGITKGKKYEVKEFENNSIKVIDDNGELSWYGIAYFKPCSQPKQPKPIGYLSNKVLFSIVPIGIIFEIYDDKLICSNYNGIDYYLPIELKDDTSYFTPIYEKTEAEKQAELWEEFHRDWMNSEGMTIGTFFKQQTKFKITRNE